MRDDANEGKNDRESERDRRLVRKIRHDPELRPVISRELFFEHFARIERTIQRRLCLHGLSYDAGAAYYNLVFDAVLERVYAPDSLVKAVKDFDSDKGRLENWLIGRVVFVIRDWLKSAQHSRSRQLTSEPVQPAEGSDGPIAEDERSVLEEALTSMSAPQRASTVLRLLPARHPTDDDLKTICEVAGRSVEEAQKLIVSLEQQCLGYDLGIREKKLLIELTFWHARQLHQQHLYHRHREALSECGEFVTDLTALEERAAKRTQETIRSEYRAEAVSGTKNRSHHQMRQRFELCCHELARCESRLQQLTKEHAGAATVPLLSYDTIAEVLNSSASKVTAYLNRARNHLEHEQNRRNAKQ